MTKLPRVYWDANAWIAYIRREMPTAENRIKVPRFDMCREVLVRAQKREIEIVTSTFSLAEVCKRRDEPLDPSVNLPAFFDQPYVLLVDVTKPIGEKAQHLQLSSIGVKPADATHLATALFASVSIFHTFDGGLLGLDNVLVCNDGQKLRTMHPGKEVPTPPLLKGMQREE